MDGNTCKSVPGVQSISIMVVVIDRMSLAARDGSLTVAMLYGRVLLPGQCLTKHGACDMTF